MDSKRTQDWRSTGSTVTSTVNNKTKPNKDPRRVEAGKKLAEHNKRERKKEEEGSLNQPEPEPSSSFSLTHILSEASVVLSLAIKEELMALLINKKPQQNTQT